MNRFTYSICFLVLFGVSLFLMIISLNTWNNVCIFFWMLDFSKGFEKKISYSTENEKTIIPFKLEKDESDDIFLFYGLYIFLFKI
jgi:hypothetical protein